MEEFQAILRTVDNLRIRNKREKEDRARKIRLKAFYSVMYGCGLRFGEAVNLIWDPTVIDFGKNEIIVSNRAGTKELPPFNVKDFETRTILMPEWVVNSILELQEVAEEGCPYLFLSQPKLVRIKSQWQEMVAQGRAKEWVNNRMMWHANRNFKSYCIRAGIKTNKSIYLHCLRKAYGTNLVNIGTPPQTLKQLMGHSSITTTMNYYVQNTDANMRKAVEGLDRLMQSQEQGEIEVAG